VFGGISASWTKSGTTITESEPTFKQVGLDALGLKFYTEVENELLSDSFTSVEGLLARMFGMAIPWFEEKAYIGGTGAGEPLGIRNADAKVQITRAAADTIVLSDLADMYSRMLPGSLGRAVWMCAPSAMEQILQIESTQGATAFLTRNLGDGPPMAILGRPLFVNEHFPALADPDTIMFVDWSYYLIGDRQALSIATSPHFRFQDDITAIRGVERLDARPWVESAITPAQGSTTLSPFVGIGT
jgi:HK97 family phage major capsid protein